MSRYIIFHSLGETTQNILYGWAEWVIVNVGDLWSLLYWAIIREVANFLYVQY